MALVLSGGGARGSAHVGVLEVMEELRIPVDLIVGTSMGAIVGGMYASGLSPDEMRQRLGEVDWTDALNDEPARQHMAYRQKFDDNKPLFKIEMGFGPDGFTAPSGLVAGQKLNFILRSMLLPAAGIERFDDLPVPFRAIAVDLDAGEMAVLDSGDLATAIRASMAFPVLFTPVEIDGRSYVDGGVLRNLPVDVALESGAEYLIVVDVSSPLKEMKEGASAFTVVRRTTSVMSKSGLEEQLALIRDQDLLIRPELDGAVAFSDFDKSGEAIELGVEAAQRHEEELRAFSVSEEEYAAFLRKQRRTYGASGIVIDSIEIVGLDRVSPKLVQRRMQTEVGDELDLELLKEDLTRLYQIGDFEQVGFELVEREGRHELLIRATEKSWGPWYVRFGAALEANLKGKGRFTAVGLLRRPQINRLAAEWRNWVTFGDFMLLDSEFYQPVEYTGTFFVAPSVTLLKNEEEVRVDGGTRVSTEIDRRFATLDAGVALHSMGEIRVGLVTGRLEGSDLDGTGTRFESDLGAVRAKLVIDRLDNANFPHRGTWSLVRFMGSREALGATDEYDRLFLEFTHAFPFRRFSVIGTARAGNDFNGGLPFYDDFELGGFLNLSGYDRRELQGSKLGLLRAVAYRRTGDVPSVLGGDLYLGGSVEYGNVWAPGEDPVFSDGILAGSLFVGVDTILGPFYVGYGLAEGGRQSFYLFLGRFVAN